MINPSLKTNNKITSLSTKFWLHPLSPNSLLEDLFSWQIEEFFCFIKGFLQRRAVLEHHSSCMMLCICCTSRAPRCGFMSNYTPAPRQPLFPLLWTVGCCCFAPHVERKDVNSFTHCDGLHTSQPEVIGPKLVSGAPDSFQDSLSHRSQTVK